MSASPVKADDFIELSSSGDACSRFKQLLRNNTLLNQLCGWLLDADGNISEEAAASMEQYTGPIGMIVAWGGSSMPSDSWRVCNGQAISRTDFSILYQRYGTAWGAGDGTTTFNLPNLQDTIPIGAGSFAGLGASAGARYRTLTIANIPAHTHTMSFDRTSAADIGPDELFPTGNDPADYDNLVKETTSIGSGEAFDTLNPVKGFYFIIKIK